VIINKMYDKKKCNVCGNESSSTYMVARDHRFNNPGEFSLARCSKCGLIYVYPQPSVDELRDYYPTDYHAHTNLDDGVQHFQKTKLNTVYRHKKTGRLLDIGCGSGAFLYVAKQNGWNVKGIEISEAMVEHARNKHGLDVVQGEIATSNLDQSSFDVVTFWHVLEHLPDLKAALSKAYFALKDDGLLVITVPNIGSFQAKVFGAGWVHLDVPRHLYHFSPNSLRYLLQNTGFQVLEVAQFSQEHSVWGWHNSKYFGNLNAYNLLLKIPYRFRQLFFYSLEKVAALSHKGACIEVVAKKCIS